MLGRLNHVAIAVPDLAAASAIYRDGLAGVFAFGAIIAAVTFKFTSNEVMLFGVAANLVAGVRTVRGEL